MHRVTSFAMLILFKVCLHCKVNWKKSACPSVEVQSFSVPSGQGTRNVSEAQTNTLVHGNDLGSSVNAKDFGASRSDFEMEALTSGCQCLSVSLMSLSLPSRYKQACS